MLEIKNLKEKIYHTNILIINYELEISSSVRYIKSGREMKIIFPRNN